MQHITEAGSPEGSSPRLHDACQVLPTGSNGHPGQQQGQQQAGHHPSQRQREHSACCDSSNQVHPALHDLLQQMQAGQTALQQELQQLHRANRRMHLEVRMLNERVSGMQIGMHGLVKANVGAKEH